MDFRHHIPGGSPSSSSSTSSSSLNPIHTNGNHNHNTTTSNNDPMHSWWESISKARSRIHLLSTLLPVPESEDTNPISSLADSDSPARSLLSSLTAFDCYFKQISQMPSWSKVDFCKFVARFAGQDCNCKSEFDQDSENAITSFSDGVVEGRIEMQRNVVEEMKNLEIENRDRNADKVTRILLPWELLQPMLRILGHCLLGPLNSNDVKHAAYVGVRCLYARASHDLVPQAILATRSLIQLDKRARDVAAMAAASAVNTTGSNANTPSKAKKPEILLVSK